MAERAWNPQAGGTFTEFKSRLAHPDAILEKLIHPVSILAQGKFVRDENTFVEPLMLTLKPTDAFLTGRFGMATYVLGQSSTGTGLRRFPYSYDMSLSPLTIDAYGTSGTSSGG